MNALIRKLCISLLSIFAVASITSEDLSAQNPTRVTFQVNCGSQGILDAPYTIYVKVSNPCDPLGAPFLVKVDIPAYSDSEFITGAIRNQFHALSIYCHELLSITTGEVIQGGGQNGAPTDKDKKKSHDLIVPHFIQVLEVTAIREGNNGDGGQLTWFK